MYLQAIHIDHSAPTPPPTVLDNGEYYERLQNLALLSMQGDYEGVEKVLNNEDIVNEKNVYLKPLYRELKHCIQYMSRTEEAVVVHKFKQKIAAAHATEDRDALIAKLKLELGQELKNIREKDELPANMLKKLENNITTLFHLLVFWTQYTEIIYAPENVIQSMKYERLQGGGVTPEEMYEKEYLNKILKSERKEEDLMYQTVEEGKYHKPILSSLPQPHP